MRSGVSLLDSHRITFALAFDIHCFKSYTTQTRHTIFGFGCVFCSRIDQSNGTIPFYIYTCHILVGDSRFFFLFHASAIVCIPLNWSIYVWVLYGKTNKKFDDKNDVFSFVVSSTHSISVHCKTVMPSLLNMNMWMHVERGHAGIA